MSSIERLTKMITHAKNMLWRIFPGLQVRLRNRFRQYPRIVHTVGTALDWRVGSGPFAGMRYIGAAAGSRLVPKLLGSYELEVHEWIEQAIAKSFRQVLVIGCAEGYYAVGLARRMPKAKVIAFDLDPRAQDLCRQMAELNEVADRIEVRGGATPEVLGQLDLTDTLIVCDCEGYENELLDPQKAAQLTGATMLVELHDCFVPGATDRLRERFQQTHSIDLRDIQPRDPNKYPVLKQLRAEDPAVAVDEDRNDPSGRPIVQQWALFRPKASGQ
jgi:hypothetical protein